MTTESEAFATIQVRNNFPPAEGKMIAGHCTFYFKNLDSEAAEGKVVVDHRTARIPSWSSLVFRSPRAGCVGAFRVVMFVILPDGTIETEPIERANRPGHCWSRARFRLGGD